MAHDLTKLEVKILEYIVSQPDGIADITDIASAIPAVTDDVLQYLRYDAQYIDWIASHSTLYKLTIDGTAALERHHLAEERRIEERAEQERNEYRKERLQADSERKSARRSWVQWTITTILTVLSFFSGAIVEKLTGFVERVLVFFRNY